MPNLPDSIAASDQWHPAKRPEARLNMCDELIAALDAVPTERSQDDEPPAPEPLDGLAAEVDGESDEAIEEVEEEPVEGKFVGPTPVSSDGGMGTATKIWMKKLVAAGVALVLLVIGIDLLVRSGGLAGTISQVAEGEEEPLTVALGARVAPEPPLRPTNAATSERMIAITPQMTTEVIVASKSTSATSPSAVESTESAERSVPDTEYTSEVEDRFVPAWVRAAISERLGTNYLTVRRVVNPGDAKRRNSLRSALEVIGGTAEVVENGSSGEDDLRIKVDSQLIRAGTGLRPIIKIVAPKVAAVGEQPAMTVLVDDARSYDG